jgi:hypothetical protein|tara:strand:+ start:1461 stop:1670 length:210 start_codon:yes stop_codon:yes gene_type:complete
MITPKTPVVNTSDLIRDTIRRASIDSLFMGDIVEGFISLLTEEQRLVLREQLEEHQDDIDYHLYGGTAD